MSIEKNSILNFMNNIVFYGEKILWNITEQRLLFHSHKIFKVEIGTIF